MFGKKVYPGIILVITLMVAPASDSWASDPFTKLGRGSANLLTGWIELPATVHRTAKEEESWFVGCTSGMAHGAGRAIARTGAGIYEMLTFLIPVPDHYGPVIEPEYVF